MITISKQQARQFILSKQGLIGAYRFKGKDGAYDYVRQAGCIQYDPVDVCGKNAEMRKKILARLTDEGKICPVMVEGMKTTFYYLSSDKIEKSSGSRHDYLGLSFKLILLSSHILSADNGTDIEPVDETREILDLGCDLKCELSCRAQDKSLNKVNAHVEIFKYRDSKSKCLARAGRSLRDEAHVVHEQRYGLLLYRSGALNAHFTQCVFELRR